MNKKNLMEQDTLKLDNVIDPKKPSMKIHQYEREHLEKIATLGDCPLARGARASTARVASYLTWARLVSAF